MFYLVGSIMLVIGAFCGYVTKRWRLDITIVEYCTVRVLSAVLMVMGILFMARGASFIGAL